MTEIRPDSGDFYRRIGATPGASADEVRSAARSAKKRTHPDVSDHPDARDRFQHVVEASDCLTDAESRAAYDAFVGRFERRAADAFGSWERFGRPGSPHSFTPPGVREPEGTDAGRRGTASAAHGGGPAASATAESDDGASARREARSSATRDESASAGTDAGASVGDPRSDRYAHRQSYERRSYAPPAGRARAWVRNELRYGVIELVGFSGLVVSSAVSLVAVVLVGFGLGLVAVVGSAAGLGGWVSLLAVGLLETGLYVAALAVGWIAAEASGAASWDDRLGNRLAPAELLYVLPGVTVVGLVSAAGDEVGVLRAVGLGRITEVSSGSALGIALSAFAVWVVCHRATMVARETPPGGSHESLRGSVATVVCAGCVAMLLLAMTGVGLDALLSGYDAPYEETYLWRHLAPKTLVGAAGVATVALAFGGSAFRVGARVRGWIAG